MGSDTSLPALRTRGRGITMGCPAITMRPSVAPQRTASPAAPLAWAGPQRRSRSCSSMTSSAFMPSRITNSYRFSRTTPASHSVRCPGTRASWFTFLFLRFFFTAVSCCVLPEMVSGSTRTATSFFTSRQHRAGHSPLSAGHASAAQGVAVRRAWSDRLDRNTRPGPTRPRRAPRGTRLRCGLAN